MFNFLATGWRHRTLLGRLARREINARYKGSLFGIVWAALLPLLMIGIYSFAFGTVMRSRWIVPEGQTSEYGFAMLLFAGYVAFSIFSDAVARSPGLMFENIAYIKKVVFPLEIMPWVAVITALANAGIAFLVFLLLFVLLYGAPPATIFLLPFVVLPMALFTLGITYALSSLGVFLRDLRQLVPLMVTALLFLSPIFYPLEAIPENFRPIIALNPLTVGISQLRDIVFFARIPDPLVWGGYFLASVLVAAVGSWWFNRTKKAFADVI